ncbi:MAG TPA: amidohydrolase family protein, partial [Candidatus Didemnitutus sp.]|nr:amidohydrolase family protein [Candidatus Didemnitutus sp.]
MKSVLLLCLLAATLAAEPVDLLLLHGNIYTGNPAQPRADAIAVRDGRIIFVGASSAAEQFRPEAKRVIDLAGKTLLPGLNDAHLHLAGIGFRELSFDLEGTTGVEDLKQKLAARIAKIGPKKWITGRGWIETHWSPAAFPTAKDLDEVSPDNPVALARADGHAVVVNSVALKLARVDRSTPAPSGGEILRYADSGEATGMLVDGAMQLVTRLIPAPTEQETEEALVVGAKREASLGWTGIQIAGHSYAESEIVRRLVATNQITLRVYDAVSAGADAEKLFAAGPVIGESQGRYTRRAVKFYMDGALGSRGAALLAPYSDYASSGLLMQQREAMVPVLVEALKRGIQLETHAIGDRGNR